MENKQLSIFDMLNLPVFPIISNIFPENESNEIEYKSAEGGFPKELWKTYSAFANSKGGIIILGIKESKGIFSVEGLSPEKINKYKKDFWNNINNPSNVSINLMSDSDVKDFVIDGKTLLAFHVPAALRTQRPVYIKNNPFENTYKRNYEGDYKCTNEEIRRMLADADLDVRPDSRILAGYTLDDFDPQSIRQYKQLFASTRIGHPWLSYDDKEFLIHLGAYRKDRKSNIEGPTLAGMLMLGKSISITDLECCPNFFPDYREILTTDPDIRWTNRIYPDGNWEANLFQFYRLVWPKLSSSLPKPFQLKEGIRQDETPAHTALREAFVNALIHTDYSAPGNIIIEQRNNNYQFTNPGTLLVTLYQYYQGGISECRNTSIQKMFLMIGSAEKAGSGVNKIMSGWEFAHWRSPYLKIESQPDRLILELPMFSILPEETLQLLRVLFGNNVDSLGKDELSILAICHIEGDITNNRLQFMIDKHRTDITKILQELCKEGYLLSENKSRWTTYHLNTDFNKNLDSSIPNLDSSIPNLDSSLSNLDSSQANLDSSLSNLDSSESNLDSSQPIKKDIPKKLSQEKLFEIIEDLCKNDYLSAEEIAIQIGRSIEYLKNDVLPVMLDQNRIERQYPNILKHPNQKFKTTK